jgi:hypothetical protein
MATHFTPTPPPSSENSSPGIFRFSDTDIEEFRALVQTVTGVWMTVEEASARAYALLTLARIIIGPTEHPPRNERVQSSSRLQDSHGRSRVQS